MIVASLLLALGAVVLLVAGLTGGSGPYLISSIAASLLAAITLVAGGRRFGADRVDDGSAHLGDESSGHLGDDAAAPVADVDPAVATGAGGVAPAEPVMASAEPVVVAPAAPDPARAGAPRPDRTRSGQLLLAPDDGAGEHRDVGGSNGYGPAVDGARAGTSTGLLDGAMDPGDLSGPAAAGGPGDAATGGPGEAATGEPGGADDEEPPDEPVAQQVSPSDAARLAGMGDEVAVIDGRPRYHLPGCVHLLTRESERLPVREAVELGFTPCGLCEPASALLAGGRRG